MLLTTCRSCNAPIRWATTERERSIPIDPDPRPDGNIELVEEHHRTIARVLTAARRAELEQAILAANRDGQTFPLNLHVSHFTTCPKAAAHRRRHGIPRNPNRKEGVR